MDQRRASQAELSADELAAQEAADLPEREAMTLVDPTTVLGGSSLPTTPTGATGGGGLTSPAPTPNVSLPHVPLPASNPGGTYQPDASASSTTT